MWLLHALRLIDRTTHLIIFPLEMCFFVAPHLMDYLHRLTQIAQTRGGIRIFIAISPVLVLIPASSNAKFQTTMTQYIHCTGHLGQQCGVAIAVAGDYLPDAYAP